MPGTAVRAFLGSQGLGALPRWVEELPRRPRRAVVVPTAGNPLPSAPWADEAAEHLAACGVQAGYLDLEGARPADVHEAMDRCELVFVTGGHPIFLLEHAQRSGFTRIARQAVLRGETAYAGMSAGASLATADLAFYQAPDDPGSAETTEGLGLVGFFPLVHANRGRQERYTRLIAAHGDRCEFVPVNDDEAVTVAGGTWQRQASAVTAPHPRS
jgi:dipeptidase E